MKDILYKKRNALNNRGKVISVSEHTEDAECKTRVRKNFVYVVHKMEEEPPKKPGRPQITVKKGFNTKTRLESFRFKIKGIMYINRNRFNYKVEYSHTLDIQIFWKSKVFSPKKSVTVVK